MSAKRTTTHGLPAIWQMVRLSVAEAGYVLDLNVYERLRSLFIQTYASGDGSQLAAITREFLQDEYLLVVDAAGQPVLPEQSIVADFEVMLQAHPSFSVWFQMDTVAEGPGSSKPVLLVARWLCHLSGLRHVTVELFLDLPDRPGATLVQIRGLAKSESPGDFDLPCAGHIIPTQWLIAFDQPRPGVDHAGVELHQARAGVQAGLGVGGIHHPTAGNDRQAAAQRCTTFAHHRQADLTQRRADSPPVSPACGERSGGRAWWCC
jgi:hypothetical protein